MTQAPITQPPDRRARRRELLQRYADRLHPSPRLSRALVSFQANRKASLHRWFKYREAFSVELARSLVEEFGRPGGVLLDPFAGVGTAVLTAARNGMDATGIEATLRAFVRKWTTTSLPHAKLLLIDELIHAFHMHYRRVGSAVGRTVIEATEKQLVELIEGLAYGSESTRGMEKTRHRWAARRKAQQIQYSKSDLQAIARELGLKGYSRMSYQALIEAIDNRDPSRFEDWKTLVYDAK